MNKIVINVYNLIYLQHFNHRNTLNIATNCNLAFGFLPATARAETGHKNIIHHKESVYWRDVRWIFSIDVKYESNGNKT